MTFPDLPDAITHGDDLDDAMEVAADCFAETIGARITERADMPIPSSAERGQVRVCRSSARRRQGGAHVAMRQQGVSPSELARSLGGQPAQVRRLLDPGRASSMKCIDHALRRWDEECAYHSIPTADGFDAPRCEARFQGSSERLDNVGYVGCPRSD